MSTGLLIQDSKAYSGFAVDDVQKAKTFYEQTLGLRVHAEDPQNGVLDLETGDGRKIVMYLSARA